MDNPPRVGFVLERSLGHITHADNLSKLLPGETSVAADIETIDYDVDGVAARLPLYGSNWTVRAGLRARKALRRLEQRGSLDALFIHTQVPAVLARRWLRRVPTVVSLDATPLQYDELGAHYGHQPGNRRVEDLKWRANRACFRRAAHIVAWAEWTKQGLVDGYGVEPAKVTVIPPGVTPSLWRSPESRAATAGPGGDLVRILFVGGDLQRKGGDLLLAAFAALRSQLESAGSGIAVELHLVTRAPVPDAAGVTVHGAMSPNSPDLVALYHACDIFCLPTRGDCLPMVLSEAGAAGMPLIATAVAAIPEIVRDGETGLVVPLDDLDALVRALRRLVEDPALRRRLGDGARAVVDERFDAERNAHRLVQLLGEVAARGAA